MKYDTNFITWHHDYVILKERHDISQQIITGLEEKQEIQQITIPVQLPGKSDACSQSFSSRSIRIEHLLVVEVEYHDREAARTKKVRIINMRASFDSSSERLTYGKGYADASSLCLHGAA
jgi:hypothetical protein